MNEITPQEANTHFAPSGDSDSGSVSSALRFDPKQYRTFLDETGWSDAQKDEFISALWEIAVSFVEMGFGRNSVQQALFARNPLAHDSSGVIALKGISNIFNESIELVATPLSVSERP